MPEPFYKTLGATIAARRVALGMTQDELARLLTPEVTRACINNIEHGKQRVLVHTLVQIAQIFGVDPASLLPPARKKS